MRWPRCVIASDDSRIDCASASSYCCGVSRPISTMGIGCTAPRWFVFASRRQSVKVEKYSSGRTRAIDSNVLSVVTRGQKRGACIVGTVAILVHHTASSSESISPLWRMAPDGFELCARAGDEAFARAGVETCTRSGNGEGVRNRAGGEDGVFTTSRTGDGNGVCDRERAGEGGGVAS